MAVQQHIHRRALLGSSVTLPAIFALPSQAAPLTKASGDFVAAIQALHDDGGQAARHAMAHGMKPEWLFGVLLGPHDGKYEPGRWPCLLFGNGKENFSFRPTGMDA